MDAVVHLSSREGLPRALPQALAAGKPVVAYDCDGAGEVCISGKTGFLLPPKNHRELMSALLQLARDPVLRKRLGHQGQQRVKERFGVERMVDELYALYLKFAAEKRITST